MIEKSAAPATKPWFGFHMPRYTYPGIAPERMFEHVVAQAQLAEELGFRQVTVMDHLYQIDGVGAIDEPMLEAYSVLNALARETKRVRLGTQVTGVTYRNPALLAKMVTTLDLTSGGRAMMGIGAAWNEVEHDAFGYDFPAVKERMDRLDEALTIIRAMFADSRPTVAGNHYRVNEVINMPIPLQPDGPPILVGGGGEQRTLRIAAKHADIVHWFPLGLEVLAHKTDLLARYCAEIGRDFASIERSIGAPVIVATTAADQEAQLARIMPERRAHITVAPPQQAADALKPYLDAGFTGFTFGNTTYRTPESMHALGETLRLIGG
ncbi:MAG: LLM class F420-dependent oxidoreductase [Chloroflexota bacterium]